MVCHGHKTPTDSPWDLHVDHRAAVLREAKLVESQDGTES